MIELKEDPQWQVRRMWMGSLSLRLPTYMSKY